MVVQVGACTARSPSISLAPLRRHTQDCPPPAAWHQRGSPRRPRVGLTQPRWERELPIERASPDLQRYPRVFKQANSRGKRPAARRTPRAGRYPPAPTNPEGHTRGRSWPPDPARGGGQDLPSPAGLPRDLKRHQAGEEKVKSEPPLKTSPYQPHEPHPLPPASRGRRR